MSSSKVSVPKTSEEGEEENISLLDVVYRKMSEKAVLQRLIVITRLPANVRGSNKLGDEYENYIVQLNKQFNWDNTTGFLLIYPTYLLHIIESARDVLLTILRDLRDRQKELGSRLPEPKVLLMGPKLQSRFFLQWTFKVYIMLAKPEKNVRSAFTTSTVVRMHVGDAKKAVKTGKSSSSMANLFRRRGSANDNVSSNGKSAPWSQNERSCKPTLWKRMSFHIKKKEPAETNQTAIIKPFSKGSPPAESDAKKLYEEPQVSQSLPCYPSQSPRPASVRHSAKHRPLLREDSDRETQVLPTYIPEHAVGIRRRGGETSPVPGTCVVDGTGDISIISVGDIGQTQGVTIMDQISCVVNRFTANINELNTMMLPGGAAAQIPAAPPGVDPSPCTPHYLTPKSHRAPTPALAEVAAAPSFGDSRPSNKIYEHLAGTCVTGKRARNTEELMALTPPSPFRDFSLSSDGSTPPPLSPTSEAEYDLLLLKHYSQSSSSL